MLLKILFQIITLLILSHSYLISPAVRPDKVAECGSTPEEAKQLGCRFDMFSFAYYAPGCFNRAHHDDFVSMHAHEIEWFTPEPDKRRVPTEIVLQGTHERLDTESTYFQDLHCTYEWRRLIRALAEKRPLDKKISELEHAQHCSKRFLRKNQTDVISYTHAGINYEVCGLTAERMREYATNPIGM